MRGHIVKRSKSSWTIVLDLERNPSNGKRRQKWVSVKGSRKEAERRLSELLHQLDQGMPVEATRFTLRNYLEVWLRDSVAARNRPRTAEGYVIIVRKHILPNLGAIHLEKLQPSDVERMEAHLLSSGLSANMVHHVHVVLAKALKDAMRKGMIQRNVCQQFDPPRPGRYEVKVPDESGIRKILDLARGTSYSPIFEFMAFTGCRRGEALALLWKNTDLERGIVSITETVQRLGGRGLVVHPLSLQLDAVG
jgi:integrase